MSKQKRVYYIWKNIFNSISIDTSENGHYNSDLIGIFSTYEEAHEYVDLLPMDEKDTPQSPAGG